MGHGDHDDGREHEPLDEGPADDDHRDEPTRGAPPDPLDRVWLHPTELPALAPALAATQPHRRPSRVRAAVLPLLAGAAGALVTVAVLAASGVFDRDTPRSPAPSTAGGAPVATVQDAAVRAGGSIVAVAAHDTRGTRRGSGVCVRHAGQLLTTARLVGDATRVDVVDDDGTRHSARVVGRDQTTDLVLLDIDGGSDLPAAQLADHTPATGATVWVVGSGAPGTKSLWMSSGMLSSADALVTAAGGPMTAGLLQTDAAASDAAVGGALVDRDGAVVGIVVGRVDDSDTTYAVPIGTAIEIAEQLENSGVARHGSAGFSGVDSAKGPTITRIVADGPAAAAGLHAGDVVVSVDGRPVVSIDDVVATIRAYRPGQTMTLEMRRGSNAFNADVTLAAVAG